LKKSSEFYCRAVEFYCRVLEFYCRVLDFYCRAMEFYCPIFLKIFTAGVLMSLEFYFRRGSTVGSIYVFNKYFKNWGSIVVGVLLSLKFFCLWSSTVSIPSACTAHRTLRIEKNHVRLQNYRILKYSGDAEILHN
jgi:hypothetical protein